MILLMDIGNTRLKLGVLKNGSAEFVTAIATGSATACEEGLRESIKALGEPVKLCAAVSVGRPAVNAMAQTVVTPAKILWIKPSAEAAGVKNAYPDPSQLGADRWVSMIGLACRFNAPHPPIVLASFGTATVVDTLSPDNEFIGGLILPGVTMMHESLARGTAKLPNAIGSSTSFPTNTASAITTGVLAAQVGAVMRQARLASKAYGQEAIICVTGGAWSAVASELKEATGSVSPLELPDIVLTGLGRLAELHDGTGLQALQ